MRFWCQLDSIFLSKPTQMMSWSSLGAILSNPGGVLGRLGGVMGRTGCLLDPLRGVLDRSGSYGESLPSVMGRL